VSQITFLDRIVAWAAPEAGVRRALARRSFDALATKTRGYDGAAKGRRTDGWKAAGTSADAEIAAASGLLRDRMRDLTRNNPHAAKAVSVLVNNIVGSGIIPRAATGPTPGSTRRWTGSGGEWSAACDADGQLDIFGLQTLAVREMIEAGEVLIRRRPRRLSDGLAVPLQVQIIEADLLDNTRNGDLADGGRYRFRASSSIPSADAAPTGFMPSILATPSSPCAGVWRASPSRPSDVLHLYEKQRTQVRGVPWGTPVMRALRDLDDWTQAELVRKKTEACVVGIVLGADEADQGIAPSVVDADGNRVEQFEPGLIAYARGGKDIRFNQPATTAGVGEWLRAQLHIVAAGFRMPYELLTGDLSQVNYSSIRAGLVEFRRLIDAVQWQIVIPCSASPCGSGSAEAGMGGRETAAPRHRGRMVSAALRSRRSAEGRDGRSSGAALGHHVAGTGHRPPGAQSRCGSRRDRRHERQDRRPRAHLRQRSAPCD
jgi:lambda family phage portal protein